MTATLDDLTAARARIAAAYDPNALESAGVRLMGTLADHLQRLQSRDGKVLNWSDPAKLVREARSWLDGNPRGSELPNQDRIASRISEIARESLARGQNLHHPHYVGHQVPASVPLAALF